MADGYRGLLAPWIGGAGNDPTGAPVGFRGMLAPWIGGAGVEPTVSAGAGYTGLLAFWAGGAANSGVAPPATGHRRPSGVFLFGQMGHRDPRY
jgi:hypothetical protein